MKSSSSLRLLSSSAAAVLLSAGITSVSAAPILLASGTLTEAHMIATTGSLDAWDATTLEWSVSQDGNLYIYQYTFNKTNEGEADLSHLMIETSDNFTISDLLAGSTLDHEVEVGKDGSSPGEIDGGGLTDQLYGVKWQVDGSSFTATIYTYRTPLWGDVFMKDGTDIQAVNDGYYAVDPPWDPATDNDGLFTIGERELAFVAVPDTRTIPEPFSVFLLGVGLLGIGALTKQTRSRNQGTS